MFLGMEWNKSSSLLIPYQVQQSPPGWYKQYRLANKKTPVLSKT